MPSAQRAVQTRYACKFRRAPREKNSNSASSATPPAAAATTDVGAHQTNPTTAGIKIAAVRMRATVPELAPAFTLVQVCLLGEFIPAAMPELRDAPQPNRRSAARASDSPPARCRVPRAE